MGACSDAGEAGERDSVNTAMTMEPRASLEHEAIDKESKDPLCPQNSSISPVDPQGL